MLGSAEVGANNEALPIAAAETIRVKILFIDVICEAYRLVSTPPLKSTLITSTARVEEAVLFLRPGDQLKRANT